MVEAEKNWIETNNAVCALLRQAHDVLAMSSFPPKRTWVGLTEDDIAQAMYKADAIFTAPMQFRFAEEIEAKLKEKNNA